MSCIIPKSSNPIFKTFNIFKRICPEELWRIMKIKLIIFLDIPYEVQLETRDWRNSEEVTKYCKNSYIDEDVHKKWLLSLQSKEKYCIC